MGSTQSTQVDEEDEEGEEEEEEQEDNDNDEMERREFINPLMKKVLEQEPEMLPCHSSASPLSPQLSNFGTPRLGPSIKVWDPYNVLAPPPPPPLPPSTFSRTFSSSDGFECDQFVTEVFLINHGDCGVNLRPDLVGGRWPEADLTTNGQRQARALAVFLNSQGVRFSSVYSSPLERARATAQSVCQELNFPEEQIQSSDELVEMSLGQWEGCLTSEVYTADMVTLIDRLQPDFCPPSGESLRQVEFRMIQFLNVTVLSLPEKLRLDNLSSLHQHESKGFSRHNSQISPNSVSDRDGQIFSPPNGDSLTKNRSGLSRKKSGKSRLQFVTTTGNHESEDEISSREANNHGHLHEVNVRRSSSSSICPSSVGIFTHAVPIKCLVTGLLGCSPAMSHKICIDDSSVTVLQYSLRTGWQVKRVNDTAHLRLL